MRIGIIVGSTRPGRRGIEVARWVLQNADSYRGAASYELVDLVDMALPLLDEQSPAAFGQYRHEHTFRWSRVVDALDGFVIVTPEYNHSMPASLKNAIDYLFNEWHNKAAGFVSYGVHGGLRAVESLRLVLAEVKVATVRTAVGLTLHSDFSGNELSPASHQVRSLYRMLDELGEWSIALGRLRS